MRVLIAEDDRVSRLMLSGVLTQQGHDVVEAVDGKQALACMVAAEDSPKLAILDWMMPELDGIDVLREIRQVPGDAPPYIIMLTSRENKSDLIAALEAGANDYIAKPFHAGELLARVRVGQRMVEMQDALLESRAALIHQAFHDALTGLPNRRAILDALERERSRAERQLGGFCVGMCDVDHFKRINDTYGHQTGDLVLQALAKTLQQGLRGHDAVGRFGGEEFLVVLLNREAASLTTVFERLRHDVECTAIETEEYGPIRITMSIGFVEYATGASADQLVGAADRALYKAKEEGRNRVVKESLQ